MGIFYFPCNFVYWRNLENHDSLKKFIKELLDNNPELLKRHDLVKNGLSTFTKEKTGCFYEEFKNHELIKTVIWDTIDQLLDTLNSRENTEKIEIKGSIINSYWFSVYDANSTVRCHNHCDRGRPVSYVGGETFYGAISLIYIVSDENEKNQTVFLQPSSSGVNAHEFLENIFDTSFIDEIGEGTVLVFPSNLHHEVTTIVKPGRIVFSANISFSHV